MITRRFAWKDRANGYVQHWVDDDGGRSKTKFYGDAGDCVTRAICIAFEKDYMEVYDHLAKMNKAQFTKGKWKKKCSHSRHNQKSARNGIFTSETWFKRYMEGLGAEWVQTRRQREAQTIFLRGDHLPKGRIIAHIKYGKKGSHYTTMIDGVLYDTWDCTKVIKYKRGRVPVIGYWKLPPRPLKRRFVDYICNHMFSKDKAPSKNKDIYL
jgi:hypothetical protein